MRRERGAGAGLGLGLVAIMIVLTGCARGADKTAGPDQSRASAARGATVPNGAFTVGLPDGWKQTWTESAGFNMPSELMLFVPDKEWPDYVAITVLQYGDARQTPERYLFDQKWPASSVKVVLVAGREAKAIDSASPRTPLLGTTGPTVPAVQRHIVVPASRGFFVLRYDAPAAADAAYRPVFDRLVESFVPADQGQPVAADPVPAREYEVYTALFGLEAPGGLDSPQFFEAVLNGRLVSGTTAAVAKPAPGWPGPDFGPLDEGLRNDYLSKNAQEWPLTDRIMVEHLTVLSPEELKSRLSALAAEGPEREQGFFGLSGGYVSLSRVGFSASGDLALLSAAFTSPRAMGAQYLVLMKKTGTAWGLEKVAMEGLWYH